MLETAYVSEDAAALARAYEKRFQALPELAGIVFISVSAKPVVGGEPKSFQILLGLSRRLDESVGWALIRQTMQDVIEMGKINISAKVFRGVSGACRDESAEGPHQDSTSADVSS